MARLQNASNAGGRAHEFLPTRDASRHGAFLLPHTQETDEEEWCPRLEPAGRSFVLPRQSVSSSSSSVSRWSTQRRVSEELSSHLRYGPDAAPPEETSMLRRYGSSTESAAHTLSNSSSASFHSTASTGTTGSHVSLRSEPHCASSAVTAAAVGSAYSSSQDADNGAFYGLPTLGNRPFITAVPTFRVIGAAAASSSTPCMAAPPSSQSSQRQPASVVLSFVTPNHSAIQGDTNRQPQPAAGVSWHLTQESGYGVGATAQSQWAQPALQYSWQPQREPHTVIGSPSPSYMEPPSVVALQPWQYSAWASIGVSDVAAPKRGGELIDDPLAEARVGGGKKQRAGRSKTSQPMEGSDASHSGLLSLLEAAQISSRTRSGTVAVSDGTGPAIRTSGRIPAPNTHYSSPPTSSRPSRRQQMGETSPRSGSDRNLTVQRSRGRFGALAWRPGMSRYTCIYWNANFWKVVYRQERRRYKSLADAEAYFEKLCEAEGRSASHKLRPGWDPALAVQPAIDAAASRRTVGAGVAWPRYAPTMSLAVTSACATAAGFYSSAPQAQPQVAVWTMQPAEQQVAHPTVSYAAGVAHSLPSNGAFRAADTNWTALDTQVLADSPTSHTEMEMSRMEAEAAISAHNGTRTNESTD